MLQWKELLMSTVCSRGAEGSREQKKRQAGVLIVRQMDVRSDLGEKAMMASKQEGYIFKRTHNMKETHSKYQATKQNLLKCII